MAQVLNMPRVKTSDPIMKPPAPPVLNRNPRRHDVVAWRNDSRIDSVRFDTKEAAQEYGRSLDWITYYKWSLMDGRDMVEKHQINPPSGWALDEDGMPREIK